MPRVAPVINAVLMPGRLTRSAAGFADDRVAGRAGILDERDAVHEEGLVVLDVIGPAEDVEAQRAAGLSGRGAHLQALPGVIRRDLRDRRAPVEVAQAEADRLAAGPVGGLDPRARRVRRALLGGGFDRVGLVV